MCSPGVEVCEITRQSHVCFMFEKHMQVNGLQFPMLMFCIKSNTSGLFNEIQLIVDEV